MAPIPELLVLVLLATWSLPPISASPGQKPPDPTLGMPWPEWELGRDPYFNGSWIGLMYRPSGRLRRVTWLADGFGLERNDPPGWERRAVLTYGDDGNCTEVEDWTMGSRDSRRFLESPQRGLSTVITQD